MKEQRAQLNYLQIAPRKVRLISNTLRGLSVSEAQAQLMHRPQRAARPLMKLLNSAVANAKNNAGMNIESLIVSQIFVDPGPVLKRSLPRSQGRATSIFKRLSHVTLVLSESEKKGKKEFTIIPKAKKVKKEETKKTPKKKGDIQPKPELHDEKKHVTDKSAGRGKDGMFKRFFRRKSI